MRHPSTGTRGALRRRRLFGLPLAWSALAGARAQPAEAPARRWAVLSLVGDSLSVVTYVPKVGSAVDTNERQTLPLTDAGLDKAVLAAVADAIAKASPGAPVAMLLAQGPAHFERPDRLLDGDRAVLPDDLLAAVRATGATHLVLVGKLRAEARLRTDRASVGSGRLEGLGFYVDRSLRLRRSDTQEGGVGFLAPFAYLNLAVVDTGTLQVASLVPVIASQTFSAARNREGFDPWDILGPKQKLEALERLVRREVGAAAASALARVGPP